MPYYVLGLCWALGRGDKIGAVGLSFSSSRDKGNGRGRQRNPTMGLAGSLREPGRAPGRSRDASHGRRCLNGAGGRQEGREQAKRSPGGEESSRGQGRGWSPCAGGSVHCMRCWEGSEGSPPPGRWVGLTIRLPGPVHTSHHPGPTGRNWAS